MYLFPQSSPVRAERVTMDRDRIDALMAEARSVAAGSDPAEALAVIGEARRDAAAADDHEAVGRLWLAEAIALQSGGHSAAPADAALAGLKELRIAVAEDHGDDTIAVAAYAAAVASVSSHWAGDVGDAVELGVEALVWLSQVDPSNKDALSASNALAQVFLAMSAFDLAAETSVGAFRNSGHLPFLFRYPYAHTLAHCAVEAARAQPDSPAAPTWTQRALDGANYLADENNELGGAATSVAAAWRGEVALILNEPDLFVAQGDLLPMSDADDPTHYSFLGDRLVSWHLLVRAEGSLRWGDPSAAVSMLDRTVPMLESLGERHRLARAIETRSNALLAAGEPARAAADALSLVRIVRSSHTEQVGHLAAQIRERADLEVARNRLRSRVNAAVSEAALDPVTGIGSRRLLERRLDEVALSTGACAVVMLDLDHFKAVNDTFGHLIGDQVLNEIGVLLKRMVRTGDTVARFGGEEFVIVMEGASLELATDVAERVRVALLDAAWSDIAEGLEVTTSAGVAQGRAVHVRETMRVADLGLYEAKKAGRNRVVSIGGFNPGDG